MKISLIAATLLIASTTATAQITPVYNQDDVMTVGDTLLHAGSVGTFRNVTGDMMQYCGGCIPSDQLTALMLGRFKHENPAKADTIPAK